MNHFLNQTPGPRPIRQISRVILGASLCIAGAATQAQSPALPSRGEMLYNTHCISCHSTQMHWRNDRKAHDWDSLTGQVRRWQGNSGLGWNDADIDEVARYLNDSIYRYPKTTGKVARLQPDAACGNRQNPACVRSRMQP